MKYLLRLIIVPLVYLACFAFSTVAIASIDGFTPFVKSLVSVAFMLIYLVLLSAVMLKEGQDAYGVLLSNNSQRRYMVETGKIVDFDATKEYGAWKGFVVGLLCCVPLIIMFLLHVISFPRGEESTVSIICEMMYGVFFSIGRTYQETNELGFFIGTGVILVAFPLMTGIPYVIGAKHRRLQQEKVRRINQELHGDKK